MKKIFAILSLVVGIGFITPVESSAHGYPDERRIVGYDHRGSPIIAQYIVTKRNCHGVPIQRRWVTLPSCSSHHRPNVSHPYSNCGPHRALSHPANLSGTIFRFGR